MTRQVPLGCVLMALAISTLVAAENAAPDATKRPDWCQKGYVCIETRQAADLTIRLADLEAQVAALKAAHKSGFGMCYGVGLGVGAMPVASGSSWDWKATGGPIAGAIFAWRPR